MGLDRTGSLLESKLEFRYPTRAEDIPTAKTVLESLTALFSLLPPPHLSAFGCVFAYAFMHMHVYMHTCIYETVWGPVRKQVCTCVMGRI